MCTLRAYGKTFDVDHFLNRCPWKIDRASHRGEIRFKRKLTHSGLTKTISDASWTNLAAQIRDAAKFIQKNAGQLRRLRRYVGVEGVYLDFPVESLHSSKVWMYEQRFPEDFIRLAGDVGLAITLSVYPKSRPSRPRSQKFKTKKSRVGTSTARKALS